MPNAYPSSARIKTYEKVVKWIKIHKTDKDENVLSLQQITDNANNIRFTLDDGSDASISMVGTPIDRGDYILIQVFTDYSGITSDGNKLRLNSNVLDYSVFTHSHLSSSVTNGVTTSINDTTFSHLQFSMSFKSGDSAPTSLDTFTSGSDGQTYYQFGKMPTATLQWKLSGSARLASSSTPSPVYFGMRPGLYLGGTAPHPFPGGIVSNTLPIDDRRYQYTFPLSQSYVQAYDESLPTNPDADGQHWFNPIYYGDDVPEAVVLTSSIYTDFEISGSVGAQWMISESKWNPHVMGAVGLTSSHTIVDPSDFYNLATASGSASFTIQNASYTDITFMITGSNVLPNTSTIIYVASGSSINGNSNRIRNSFNVSKSISPYDATLQHLTCSLNTTFFPNPINFYTTVPGLRGNKFGIEAPEIFSAVSFSGGTSTDEIYFNNLTWSLHFLNDAEDDAVGQATYNVPTSFTGSHTPSPPYVLFEPTFTSPFQNSNWDVNMNNINDNRLNSFLMNVDYSTDLALPINLQPIRNRVEKKTQTPDSNYTTKRIIDPRYNGSRLSSYDYNAYTPPSGSTPFIFTPDESVRWGGDVSYGKTAVIDKRPIYFAHFVESHPTLESIGEMEFTIDYLIPVDIEVGENANAKSVPSIGSLPGVIKVNGDGTYQYEVSNIFEKKRKTSIDYSQNLSASINWGSLEGQPYEITQGGSLFKGIVGNQRGTFNLLEGQSDRIWFSLSSSIGVTSQFQISSPRNFLTPGINEVHLGGDGGELYTVHSFNRTRRSQGIPLTSDRYFRWLPSASIGYNNYNEIFLLEKGDEIRFLDSNQDDITFTIKEVVNAATMSVFPNPDDYTFPLTSSFFIRRKVDQDNKIRVATPFVYNTLGTTTFSSDGFLIPDDLSLQQKTRAGHLIATLRGDNLFS